MAKALIICRGLATKNRSDNTRQSAILKLQPREVVMAAVNWVADIAAMKALAPGTLANGDAVVVDEKGRGGTFVWNTAATTTDDDGTVF